MLIDIASRIMIITGLSVIYYYKNKEVMLPTGESL